MKRLTYLFLVCVLLISSVAHAATVRTVALSGQQAPGTPSGVNFGSIGSPVLNNAGQTAFRATLAGSGVDSTNNVGIWSEGSGSVALVTRTGIQAPGTSAGVNFLSVGGLSPVLNDAGQTAFKATLSGIGVDSTNSNGVWSEGHGSLALVARAGSQAPGTPSGVNYSFFLGNRPLLNKAGQTAFLANLTGSNVDGNNSFGIWSEGSGSLALVARYGNQAPGAPSGANYREFSPFFKFNDAGQTAFQAALTGGGYGIWSEHPGGLAPVVLSGSHAPGTPSGVNFLYLNDSPTLNNAGQTAFIAPLTGNGVDATNDWGIWSEGSGSLAMVAREGDQAAGAGSGVMFSTLQSSPVLNKAGKTAFVAVLTDGRSGIWSEGFGSLALVARTGIQAPGTPSGVNFSFINAPMLNDSGQIAFGATLTGNGVNSSNNQGIWATDWTGDLRLVASSGNSLQVAPDDYRTISSLVLVAGTGTSSFNNLGQLAFLARFTDGTEGIFVSNRVAVPEPSTFILTALGFFGSVIYRWRSA